MHKEQMVWHAYHAGSLCQLVDFEARRAQIEEIKPEKELPTRRRLMKPVVGQLPEEFVMACKKEQAAWRHKGEEWEVARRAWAAWAAWEEAWEAAREARDAAYRKHKVAIEKLHAKECPDCPWDGETIFPD